MEISDFAPFLLMTIFLFVPLMWIYLILYTLNWGERKNLFLDSWVVFLAWIFSGLAVWIFCISAEFGFYKLFHPNLYVTFFSFTILANVFSIAAVLKTREKKKNLSILSDSDKNIKQPDIQKIWRTSVIVSLLTLAMMTSLVMFVGNISAKMEKSNPNANTNTNFKIYD
ncbi:hypothetical protein BH20ACI4_BH20ACI4_13480 [soil metagenome]